MKKLKLSARAMKAAAVVLSVGFLCAAAGDEDFLEQRRQFRKEIENKVEVKLTSDGSYLSVIFKDEAKKYNFRIAAEDADRLGAHLQSYLFCADPVLIKKMLAELNRGRYLIYKQYENEGVLIKVVFLIPKCRYWEWLTDYNGVEKMFHVYNFSVGLYAPDPDSRSVILQTEGSFFGVAQAVNLPIVFSRDFETRQVMVRMPTQAEMISHLSKMPALKPGRDQPREKFIDACRTHPYFQQTDAAGRFTVTDEEIEKLYRQVVVNKDEECAVKDISGGWQVHEDYPFLVVDYSLKTTVNVEALIPESMRILAGAAGPVVQQISDEVSVKYLPLSMKNFRDHAQEWTRTGGPE